MLMALSMSYAKWTYTLDDLLKLSPAQIEVLRVSYLVGESKDLGYTLQAISIVENNARMTDKNKNRICGPHQVDYVYAETTCEALESNPYVSAMAALGNLLFWQKKYKGIDWRTNLIYYNGGDVNYNKHGPEYIRRVSLVYKLLRKHDGLLYTNRNRATS